MVSVTNTSGLGNTTYKSTPFTLEKVSAYTYGMEGFGKKEMEILASSENPEDVYYFLQAIADYVITSDVILQDGETIGFTAEQKISISQSKGVAVNGTTLKLGY